MRKRKLEWYAFEYDFNNRKVQRINVLRDTIRDEIIKRLKSKKDYWSITDYNSLKENVKRILMSYYWCRAEHEILVTDLFPKDFEKEAVKLDVWYQLEPNLDRIVEYVIKELEIEF